jgi:hypothetical protein
MLICARYRDVRSRMQAGDVIAFSGSGWISSCIKFFQRCPVSHVGVVYETDVGRVDLMESTSLDGCHGVQQTHLSTRLERYGGPMWWLPLSNSSRLLLDRERLWNALTECRGRPYDFRQVAHHAVDLLHLWAQGEDVGKLFCSELVAYALKCGGVLPCWIDSAEVRPVDLVSMRIYDDDYYQLRGEEALLPRFNIKDPHIWRNKL